MHLREGSDGVEQVVMTRDAETKVMQCKKIPKEKDGEAAAIAPLADVRANY